MHLKRRRRKNDKTNHIHKHSCEYMQTTRYKETLPGLTRKPWIGRLLWSQYKEPAEADAEIWLCRCCCLLCRFGRYLCERVAIRSIILILVACLPLFWAAHTYPHPLLRPHSDSVYFPCLTFIHNNVYEMTETCARLRAMRTQWTSAACLLFRFSESRCYRSLHFGENLALQASMLP